MYWHNKKISFVGKTKALALVLISVAVFSITVTKPGFAQSFDSCYQLNSDRSDAEAESCWKRYLQRDPSHARAHYYLAQSLRRQADATGSDQKLDDAIVEYETAISLENNNYAWAWNGLANVHFRRGDILAAEEAYRNTLSSTNTGSRPASAHAVAYTNLGRIFISREEFNQASEHLSKAIQIERSSGREYFDPQIMLSVVLREQGEIEIDSQLKEDKFNQSIRLLKGVTDKIGCNTSHLNQILSRECSSAYNEWGEVLTEFGKLYKATGRTQLIAKANDYFNSALQKFSVAVEKAPRSPYPHIGLGDVLSEQKEFIKAIERYKAADKLKAQDLYNYIRWGDALFALGNIQEAISKYEDATKILYGNTARLYPLAYAKWGFALAEQARRSVNPVRNQKFDEAIEKYRTALKYPDSKRHPTIHSWAGNNIGLILWQQNKLEEAQEAFAYVYPASDDSKYDFIRNNFDEVVRQIRLKNGEKPLSIGDISFLTDDTKTPTKRSVVKIFTTFWSGNGMFHGTGWLLGKKDDKAYIVTNRHVIRQGSRLGDKVEIELYYGDDLIDLMLPRLDAKIRHFTTENNEPDLAVLEVDNELLPPDINELVFSNSEMNRDTPATIVGSPEMVWLNGLVQTISVPEITISPEERLMEGWSGSPLLDSENQVSGLIFQSDPVPSENAYAHPINFVSNQLREWGLIK